MDRACFEAWLEGIQSLTVEQRGGGFRELALAEAVEESGPVAWGSPDEAAVVAPAMSDGAWSVAEEPASKMPDEAMAEPVSLATVAAHKGPVRNQLRDLIDCLGGWCSTPCRKF